MPITPISQYRGQDNSLAQILKGGTDTISGILNQAIQLGRDRVNNQYRQDDQVNQKRAAETALEQRRGENLTSLIQDNRRIAQNQQNVDRQYGRLLNQDALAQSNTDRQYRRQETQDALNKSNADRQFEFNQNKESFDRKVTEQEIGFKQRDEQRDAVTDALNQTTLRLKNQEYAQELANPKPPEGEKPVTPAEKRSATKFEQSQLDRQQKEAEDLAKQHPMYFQPQEASFKARYAKAKETYPDDKRFEDYDTFRKNLDPLEVRNAELYDADLPASQVGSAKSMGRDEFIAFAQDDKGKKIRGDFWDKVNGEQSNTGADDAPGGLPNKQSSSAVSRIPGI